MNAHETQSYFSQKDIRTRRITQLDEEEEREEIVRYFKGTLLDDEYRVNAIYKVRDNGPHDDNRILTFHGTRPQNILNIMKIGLKNSNSGCCGHTGVYLSCVSAVAKEYGKFRSREGNEAICVLVVSIPATNIKVMPKDKKVPTCQTKNRKREYPVEEYPGDISFNIDDYRNFSQKRFLKKSHSRLLH